MRPITLNLASRPFRNNILVGSLLTVIGVGLVAATAYNLYVYLGYGNAYARLQQEQAADRARIGDLQVEERRLAEQLRGRNFREAYERGKLASELVRKSAFSWTQLFNTLEGVVPPDVVMTAIRPNISAEAIVIRIEGVAKNSGAFLALQERLLKNPMFTRVYPTSERRLNPNLPDITFLLSCDYLPQPAAPAGQVAEAKAGEGAPPASAATASTTPTAPAAAGAVTPGGGAAAHPAGGAGAQVAQASVTVGRDGRVVADETGPVLAPGALFTPPAPGPASEGAKKGGRRRATTPAVTAPKPAAQTPGGGTAPAATAKVDTSKPSTSKTATPKTDTPQAGPQISKPASATPTTPAKQGGTRPAAKNSATDATDAAAGPATTAGAAPKAGPVGRVTAGGRVWDPNVPRTMPPQQKAALASQPRAPEQPATATRLDLPLSFAAAPAGDVYDRLAQAHGVVFEFAPGVDRSAPVTLNLQGRNLEDALALVAGQTHQRVRKVRDGVYRVEGAESGRTLAVPPVTEEPITEEAP